MKNKLQFIKIAIVFVILLASLIIVSNTRIFNNLWVLLTDSSNYIPDSSNILIFQPTQIDSGSGGYWRYGEDDNNYYYFSEKEKNVYIYAAKVQNCKGLRKFNYSTWCKKYKAYHTEK